MAPAFALGATNNPGARNSGTSLDRACDTCYPLLGCVGGLRSPFSLALEFFMRPVSEATSIPSISSILDEMRLLPEEIANLAGKLAAARTESRRTSNAMSSAYNEAWLRLKVHHGLTKQPTVDDLKALTEQDSEYVASRDAHLLAQDRVSKIEAALSAMEHKSRMLQSIGALVRHQTPAPTNPNHPLSDVDNFNE
jgi:hypothetical protein